MTDQPTPFQHTPQPATSANPFPYQPRPPAEPVHSLFSNSTPAAAQAPIVSVPETVIHPTPPQAAPPANPEAPIPTFGTTTPNETPQLPPLNTPTDTATRRKAIILAASIAAVLLVITGASIAALRLTGNSTTETTDLSNEDRITELLEDIERLENIDTDVTPALPPAIQTTTTTAAPTTTTAAPAVETAAEINIPTGYDDISDVERVLENIGLLEVALLVELEQTVDQVRGSGRNTCEAAFDAENQASFDLFIEASYDVLIVVEQDAQEVFGGLEGWIEYQDRLLAEYCPQALNLREVATTPVDVTQAGQHDQALFIIGSNDALAQILADDPDFAYILLDKYGVFYCAELELWQSPDFQYDTFIQGTWDYVAGMFPSAPEIEGSNITEFEGFVTRVLQTHCADQYQNAITGLTA